MTIRRHEFIVVSIPGPGLLHDNLHEAISRVSIVPEWRPGSPCGRFVCNVTRRCRVLAGVLGTAY